MQPTRPIPWNRTLVTMLLIIPLSWAMTNCSDDDNGGPGPQPGTLGGPCFEDGTCNQGLVCSEDRLCIEADSCEGIDCSGHGTCEMSEGQPTCVCEQGFHAQGLACLENDDQDPPVISDLQARALGSALIEVTWTTDEPATSFVDLGRDSTDGTYGTEDMAMDHRVVVSGLATETTYVVKARSADEWGNEASSDPMEVTTNGIADLLVRQGHPILMVDEDVLAGMRARTDQMAAFHDLVHSMYMTATDDPSDTATIRHAMDQVRGHDPRKFAAPFLAVDAVINDNELARAYGKQLLISLIERNLTFANGDAEPRAIPFGIGFLYDWLYDDLDDTLKRRARERIIDSLDFVLDQAPDLVEPVFVNHARLTHTCALVGLLPIFYDIQGDGPEMVSRYTEWLDRIVSHYRLYILPDQAWASKGGMNHMGWAYGTSYSRMTPYLVWEYAVEEETWLWDWQGEIFYSYLYGMRNDQNEWGHRYWDQFPYWGDSFDTYYGWREQASRIMVAASNRLYGNDVAKWLLIDGLYTSHPEGVFTGVFYQDFGPDDVKRPDDLPLSRWFPNSGYVVIRDRWDDPSKNTLVVFRSGSFWAFNHNHRDMNAFTIYYKGPLAIDSGGYNVCGAWGSVHWWNYYIRSVAHNTILVYDPDEVFQPGSRHLSNDGGQKFFEERNPHLADMLERGSNNLDGVLAYEEAGDYTYVLADATRAYSANKMSLFQRSMVTLRNHSYDHPAIVIYDHVVATSPDFPKTYLLHSIEEPTVVGDLAMIHIDAGLDPSDQALLYQTTLLPQNHDIRVIGGPGHEFFVADDGTGNPHNYDENCDGNDSEPLERQKGAWRIEVRPSQPSATDFFLHVLSVTDEADHNDAVEAHLVQSDHLRGAIVVDPDGQQSTLVLFAEHGADLDETVSLPDGVSFQHLLVVGLQAGTTYGIDLGAGTLTFAEDTSGTSTTSRQGTVYEQVE